jgi:DNA-binding NtrC family response regulator
MSYIPKILIVDDEPRMCDSLKFLLSGQDYEVFTANSGQDALQFFSENEFDVAVLDIVMPDIDGHQLMDRIRERNPEAIVILMSGHASLDSAARAIKSGAWDYIRKPFEYDELLKTVQNALDQKRLRREDKGY